MTWFVLHESEKPGYVQRVDVFGKWNGNLIGNGFVPHRDTEQFWDWTALVM